MNTSQNNHLLHVRLHLAVVGEEPLVMLDGDEAAAVPDHDRPTRSCCDDL